MAGGWTFRLPCDFAGFEADLDAAALLGKDALPWPTDRERTKEKLVLRRDLHDAASLQVPLTVPDFGRILVQTCPLPEGGEYRLLLELARGEVDKARTEFAEWERLGLRASAALNQTLRNACNRLTHAVFSRSHQSEYDAVRAALWCGELAAEEFGRHAATARKGRPDKPIRLSCVFDDRFYDIEEPAALRKLFDAVTVPVNWRSLELDTGERQWDALGKRVDWCLDRGLAVTVGPILDLHALPTWIETLGDSDAALSLMIDLVETAVAQLQDRVTSWEVVSGVNSSRLAHGDDRAMMLLVMKTLDAVRRQDPQARLALTFDRPWGDYLATGDRHSSPIDFLDQLLRIDAPISSINLEIAIGVAEEPSHRRSIVDFCRMIDRYADLGPALAVRLFHPAEVGLDSHVVGQSAEDRQADWLESHVLAALAKSAVERVEWGRLHDIPSQRRLGCGLFAESGRPRRALRRLRAIRKACF